MKQALIALAMILASTVAHAGPQFECNQNGKPSFIFQFNRETLYWQTAPGATQEYGYESSSDPIEKWPSTGDALFNFSGTQSTGKPWTALVPRELLLGKTAKGVVTVVDEKFVCDRVYATPVRPDAIKCKLDTPAESIPETIFLYNLNSTEPQASLDDQSLVDPIDEIQVRSTGKISMFFSNECDNSYEIDFVAQDLADLRTHKVRSITGDFTGDNADSQGTQNRKLICTLK